jgi:hypothetical protein
MTRPTWCVASFKAGRGATFRQKRSSLGVQTDGIPATFIIAPTAGSPCRSEPPWDGPRVVSFLEDRRGRLRRVGGRPPPWTTDWRDGRRAIAISPHPLPRFRGATAEAGQALAQRHDESSPGRLVIGRVKTSPTQQASNPAALIARWEIDQDPEAIRSRVRPGPGASKTPHTDRAPRRRAVPGEPAPPRRRPTRADAAQNPADEDVLLFDSEMMRFTIPSRIRSVHRRHHYGTAASGVVRV